MAQAAAFSWETAEEESDERDEAEEESDERGEDTSLHHAGELASAEWRARKESFDPLERY